MFSLSFHFILFPLSPSSVPGLLVVMVHKSPAQSTPGVSGRNSMLQSSSSEQPASQSLEKGRIVQLSGVCVFCAVERVLEVHRSY